MLRSARAPLFGMGSGALVCHPAYMPSNHPWVCVPCRYVARQTNTCPHCGAEMVSRHYSWRAPRRTNDAAWKLIEAGVWLWDRKRVERFKIPWPVTGTKERRGGRIHSPRLP